MRQSHLKEWGLEAWSFGIGGLTKILVVGCPKRSTAVPNDEFVNESGIMHGIGAGTGTIGSAHPTSRCP